VSNAEILAQLPKLKAEERAQVYQRLCELQEQDLLHGIGPTEEEKNCWIKPWPSSIATATPARHGARFCNEFVFRTACE
jgi:hypothetical protein